MFAYLSIILQRYNYSLYAQKKVSPIYPMEETFFKIFIYLL